MLHSYPLQTCKCYFQDHVLDQIQTCNKEAKFSVGWRIKKKKKARLSVSYCECSCILETQPRSQRHVCKRKTQRRPSSHRSLSRKPKVCTTDNLTAKQTHRRLLLIVIIIPPSSSHYLMRQNWCKQIKKKSI